MRRRITIVFLSVLFGLLTLLPYILAERLAGGFRFTGFLFNPLDGASYLAKMRQGWDGSWLYTLAFTDSPGPGAFLFTYYLFLGHLARWTGASLIMTYHAARVAGTAFFLIAVWETFGKFGLTGRARTIGWITILIGSGFGWAAALAGTATSDLWVAECIPFLGMLTSAHFPLAMALLLILAAEVVAPGGRRLALHFFATFASAIALAILQPFAILPLALALAGWLLWNRRQAGRFPEHAVTKFVLLAAGAAPFAVYDFWVTRAFPAFASWAAQNQTPAPPVWDMALSLGPLGLILVISAIRWAWFREPALSPDGPRLFFILWLASMALLLYLPIPLQRRMLLGGMLPMAILAAPHIERWMFAPVLQGRRLAIGLLLLPLSNLMVLGAMARVIQTRDPLLFLRPDPAAAMDWLAAHAAPDDVVLAPPGLSAWIPGFTGLRVVYGHPMETPDAAEALQDVTAFYQGKPAAEAVVTRHSIRWIYCSTDAKTCPYLSFSSVEQTWSNAGARLYRVR